MFSFIKNIDNKIDKIDAYVCTLERLLDNLKIRNRIAKSEKRFNNQIDLIDIDDLKKEVNSNILKLSEHILSIGFNVKDKYNAIFDKSNGFYLINNTTYEHNNYIVRIEYKRKIYEYKINHTVFKNIVFLLKKFTLINWTYGHSILHFNKELINWGGYPTLCQKAEHISEFRSRNRSVNP